VLKKRVNPLNEAQFEQLHKSIEWSNQQLAKPREKRLEAIREFVGFHHADDGARRRVITPILKLIVSIYLRTLAPRAPRVLFTTKNPQLRPTAANLQLAVNEIPSEIDFQATLRRLVLEALFGVGVTKTGLSTVGEVLGHEYGDPFVDVVTLDHLVLDMAARNLNELQYVGNDYWLDYKDVMESQWPNKKALDELEPDDYTLIGPAGEERAKSIAQGGTAELFKEKIWLRDVWLPSEGLIVTYGVTSKKRLKTVEWTGPDHGPYSFLGFDIVPGNLLPLAPVSVWRDLHEVANTLFRKLADQADKQKTVPGFSGGNDDSVINFKTARDGEGINYFGGPPVKLTTGGADPTTLALFLQCKDLSSYFAGNIDAMGGLSPQSETLGQDKLISEASSAQLRGMADQVIDFTKGIFKTLAFYEWNDPVRTRVLQKSIPETELSIEVPWNRQSRHGRFEDFDMEIDVYSLQDNSPSIKLQKLAAIMQQYINPLMPAIEQAGGILDVQTLLTLVGQLADFHEVSELIRWADSEAPQGANDRSPMAQSTTRRYERVNRPGATESGKSQILQQALLGGRPQKDETASIGRSTG
jgi:hypothetical protein